MKMQPLPTPPWTRTAVLWLIGLTAFVSADTFNGALTGIAAEDAVHQGNDIRPQMAALAMWGLLTCASFVPGVARMRTPTAGLARLGALLGWITLSPLWSDDPVSGLPKAMVFLATSLAAWRLAAVVSVAEMAGAVFWALYALTGLSFGLALLVPSIGVLHNDYFHEGQWLGMFATKQGLGMVSTFFLVMALLRLSHRRTVSNAVASGLGLACLLGSGSRGAAVMAGVAVLSLMLVRVKPRLAPVATTVLLAGMSLGVLQLGYFAATGNISLQVLGLDINFTERSYIWAYAIAHWLSRPWLGYGLNEFWTSRSIYLSYLSEHGWVLDNYHSGYVAIAVETGLLGLAGFAAVAGQLARRLQGLLLTATSNRLSLEIAAAIAIMFFTINLTETYFLRSTNFMAVLFSFLLVKVLAQPQRQVRARADPSLQPGYGSARRPMTRWGRVPLSSE